MPPHFCRVSESRSPGAGIGVGDGLAVGGGGGVRGVRGATCRV